MQRRDKPAEIDVLVGEVEVWKHVVNSSTKIDFEECEDRARPCIRHEALCMGVTTVFICL